MLINGARAVSALTNKGAPDKIGVTLRPCELRALVELVKLQQASLDSIILIGLDCPGTFEIRDFQAGLAHGTMNSGSHSEIQKVSRMNLTDYLAFAVTGDDPAFEGISLRPACSMCVYPVPENADITLELFGATISEGIPATMADEIAKKLGLAAVTPSGEARQSALDRLLAKRREVREKELSGIQERLTADGNIAGLFAACIRCHNCMTVCPICYCKTCLFKTASFDHPPEHYFNAARRKGATRMLGDTLLFHMTRLNHMGLSCISCGMCTSACPADIPVGAVFSAIGARVQAAFDYVPGQSVDEPLPLVTFQANEWTEVGEG
jgi:formate dehydrogenase subunit beta